ncbi:MAG: exodeoxyribonuclease VII large subunit [Rhodocyclaceae bacterium]|nr:exodeoxyribonuclease VII large subunit [Rhodocyclaceae bacterium]
MPEKTDTLPVSGNGILSVSALNRIARQALEERFPLLWVGGEVSNLRRPASGHAYFALKDENAQVDCVMFRNRAQLLPFRIQDGLRVEVRALVTIYEARGGFQLNVESMRQAGIGALYEAFSRLRDKLEGEGLFAPERRQPLPRYPRRIGIVTSLQAAALHDILASLSRRAPHLPVIVYPTLVQGEAAGANIAEAIRLAASRAECDLLLVSRGGGSIEDLWAFNEEGVVRAIDACRIPVITGIGHETDTTIADLVADCRAATPTAAAELASAGYVEAQGELLRLATALVTEIRRGLQQYMQRIDLLGRRLIHPGERLARLRAEISHLATRLIAGLGRRITSGLADLQRIKARFALSSPDIRFAQRNLDEVALRMRTASSAGLYRHRNRLERLAANLNHLAPHAVLQRGYSLVRKADGSIVNAASQLVTGDSLHLSFGQGEADALVTRLRDN